MNLPTKVILLIVAVMLGAGLGSSLLVNRVMRNTLENELYNQAVIGVRGLAEHVSRAVINGDVVDAREAVQRMVERSQNIQYAYIIGFDGCLFAHSFEGGFPRAFAVRAHQRTPSARSPTAIHLSTNTGLVLDVSYPLIEGMTAHIHIGMDEEPTHARIAELRNGIIRLILLLTAAGVAIGIVVSRRLTHPLTELAGAMHDFGERKESGELAFRSGGKEMAELTRAFNRMSSDRREAEEALKYSEGKFRELAELLPEVVFECDAQGKLNFANRVAFDKFGYTREDFDNGVHAQQFIAPDDRQRAGENIEKALRGIDEGPAEYIAQHKDDSEFPIIVFSSPIIRENGPVGLRGIIVDITDRKFAEEALRESEQKYRGIFDSTTDSLLVFNTKGGIVEANLRACEMYGYEYGELTRLSGKDIVHPDHHYVLENFKHEVRTTGEFQTESVGVHKDGSLFDVDIKGAKLDFKGEPHLLAILRDITEHKRAEAERERLMSAIEQAAEIVVITDADATVQYVNPAFGRVTGYTREEAIGQNLRVLKSGQQDEAFYKEMWNMLLRGDAWSGRIVNRKKDGSLYTKESVISPVRDASGRTVNYVAVERDITEVIKLEEQYRQSQKMESVGRLAGGVAHDFNNMLSVILGHTELAMDQVDPAGPLFADLQEIRKAAERSADLTRQLLSFARKQTIAPKVLDLNEAIEGMLKMLRRLIGEDIDLAWLPGSGTWHVRIDPSQIDQVLANLCVNARNAITDVGNVTIETGNATFDDAYCHDHLGFEPGEYVLLAISDNGCGMDKETLGKLFEPFFTTKETGIGLGLATTYGIVKQNNGFINVYSEPGDGTTFRIYLPRHAGKTEQVQEEDPAKRADQGHETILLVEDEPAILKLATTMLERQGYTVLAATTPGEAIRLAGEYTDTIHLLLTDVVMPEMNGRDLAKEMLSLYPNLKRLFMSGYTANVIAHRGVIDEDVDFIQKPFAVQDLAAKVRETLDSN